MLACVVKVFPTAMILPDCNRTANARSFWEGLTSVVTRPFPPRLVSGAPSAALNLSSAIAVCAVELVAVFPLQAVRAADTRRTGKASPEHHEIFRFICTPFPGGSLVQIGCFGALQFAVGGPHTHFGAAT